MKNKKIGLGLDDFDKEVDKSDKVFDVDFDTQIEAKFKVDNGYDKGRSGEKSNVEYEKFMKPPSIVDVNEHKGLNTEATVELSTKKGNCRKLHDKTVEVVTQEKHKEDSEKEMKTFYKVACETRSVSLVLRKIGDECNLENMTLGEHDATLLKEK